ncbi:drug resistance transporter, EmrB/QacA subfamily [Streptosporangium subroseum]|uniref:Drug resistance transporter, EmrB/QacA subfamily n=1 Tax=Streptosporangium subroseum TaxID=106412 RepID=A0A239CY77_9ACTN|nr:MFS transporter [Streptosporangium subroseum]SNS24832.1 drug resistance transporter, EmrB/QacA subfamily [Streptosporangium subroseum]
MTTEVGRPHHHVTFAVLTAGIVTYSLLQSLVTPVLPTIQSELHTGRSTVTWVLTAYLLSASIFTPIMGRAGDLIGKKRVFVAALIALSLGALLAALATDVTVLIIARAIQGIGGGVLPLAFGIVRDEFPREKVSGAVGAIASLTAAGGAAGIVLAGPIVGALGYPWLFWLPMILTAASAVAAHFLLPESPGRSPGRIGLLPAVLMSGWLVALLVAVGRAPDRGWGSGEVIVLLVVAVGVALAWIRVEKRSARPLIDMAMMRQPAVWTNNLIALLVGVAMYALFAFVPVFVQTPTSAGYGFGASVTQSGLMVLPQPITMFLAGMITGGLSRRIGERAVVMLGLLVSLASVALLTFARSEEWELYLATTIMGAGFGFAFSAMSSLIVGAVPPAQTGVASGMNANIRTVGGSIGTALMAGVVTADLRPDGLPEEAGYTNGFGMLGVTLVMAAFAVLLVPRSRGVSVAECRPPGTATTAMANQAE